MSINNANKGKKLPEETKQKISNTLKGKKLSEETKKKLSKAGKGKVWINNGIISKRVSTDNIPAGFVKGRI